MVEAIQNVRSSVIETANAAGGINWQLIGMVTILAIIGLILFTIIIVIVTKILKKIKDSNKSKRDLEFYKYNLDIKMCKLNKDAFYVRRAWYLAWLGFKRAKVYAQTSRGRRFIGYYVGEATKKEDFFLFALEQRHSFFKRETDVVIMPYKLMKHTVKYNDDFTIDLVCEGIDEVMSSEFYSMPVYLRKEDITSKQNSFIDFSNMVSKQYFEEYVYRDVIKENLIEFREGISTAATMNPSIQLKRKSNSDLRE